MVGKPWRLCRQWCEYTVVISAHNPAKQSPKPLKSRKHPGSKSTPEFKGPKIFLRFESKFQNEDNLPVPSLNLIPSLNRTLDYSCDGFQEQGTVAVN